MTPTAIAILCIAAGYVGALVVVLAFLKSRRLCPGEKARGDGPAAAGFER